MTHSLSISLFGNDYHLKGSLTRFVKIFIGMCLLLELPVLLYSQDTLKKDVYAYKQLFYSERIELFQNGTFMHRVRTEFTEVITNGKWQLRNDSNLILDSSPQRTKLIVWESRKKKKMTILNVRGVDNDFLMTYHLYLISPTGDTLKLRDQWDETETKYKFDSFYIINTDGLYSPVYKIQGSRSNHFEVHFETHRVFENEYWIFKDKAIIPKGTDNRYGKYQLVKQE